MKLVISIENLPDYEHFAAAWFANVASHHLLSVDIHELASRARINKPAVLNQLYVEAEKFIGTLSQTPCTMPPPVPLTPNDTRDFFNPCTALNLLGDASRGQSKTIPLPPALSFEFAEYVRVYMPKVKPSTLKRGVIYVTSDVLALSVLGAYASRVYVIEDEYGYSFVSIRNPALVDITKLNNMAKSVVRSVAQGAGSKIAIYIGVASAIALNTRMEHLYEEQGRSFYTSIRIARTGNKTMLKAYELVDLTGLALEIKRLRIASPVYNLVVEYPERELAKRDKRARTARSVIEELSKAVYQYYVYRDPLELYRVLRTITTKTTSLELLSYLPEDKRDVVDRILEIRI